MSYSPANQNVRDKAIAAYQAADPDALVQIQSALQVLPGDGGLLICEAGALIESAAPDPLDNLVKFVRAAPDWVDGHMALARYRFEQGDPDCLAELEQALTTMPDHLRLSQAYAQLLTNSGNPDDAADVMAKLRGRYGRAKELLLLEARYSGMAGQIDRATSLFRQLPSDWPEKSLDEARHLLRQNQFEEAEKQLAIARNDQMNNVTAWALTEICWRVSGDPRHAWLLPQEILPVQWDMQMSDEDMRQLASLLRGWHSSVSRPLNQSVRAGTQTRGNLFLRQNDLIAAVANQFRRALQDFQKYWPADDEHHPIFQSRSEPLRLASGWSILIRPPGYHVNHVHDGGRVSSAFHVEVPADEGGSGRDGWLQLGGPPQDIPAKVEPLASFQPKPGYLVLFPSFLYHGTRPIQQGERLTIAFDAM